MYKNSLLTELCDHRTWNINKSEKKTFGILMVLETDGEDKLDGKKINGDVMKGYCQEETRFDRNY